MYKKLFCLTCFVLLMSLTGSAFGAAYTWDDEDTNDHYWHSPRNWAPNDVPGTEDSVSILTTDRTSGFFI